MALERDRLAHLQRGAIHQRDLARFCTPAVVVPKDSNRALTSPVLSPRFGAMQHGQLSTNRPALAQALTDHLNTAAGSPPRTKGMKLPAEVLAPVGCVWSRVVGGQL
jgi:hypothetical protein